MTAARALYRDRGHKRVKPLIDFAIEEGWMVVRTPGGHLKFTKQGFPPIYTGATAGEHRADRNVLARLRRVGRINSHVAATRKVGADG
jgi:hypothetical protein